MLSLGLEMAMMFHKYHFYSLMCLCSVLCIFFLNYFDSLYIKTITMNLLISCLMDVIWEIARARVHNTITIGLLAGQRCAGFLPRAFEFDEIYYFLRGWSFDGEDDDGCSFVQVSQQPSKFVDKY